MALPLAFLIGPCGHIGVYFLSQDFWRAMPPQDAQPLIAFRGEWRPLHCGLNDCFLPKAALGPAPVWQETESATD
jgi:hypothetical protein